MLGQYKCTGRTGVGDYPTGQSKISSLNSFGHSKERERSWEKVYRGSPLHEAVEMAWNGRSWHLPLP